MVLQLKSRIFASRSELSDPWEAFCSIIGTGIMVKMESSDFEEFRVACIKFEHNLQIYVAEMGHFED